MKLAVIASLLASAAAFVPTKQAASSTALNAFEDALGAQPPLGFFDPLGLVADGDQEKFERLRYVELKHGRICMLGFLGQITTRYGIHFEAPLDKEAGTTFSDYPNGIAALFGPNAIPSDRFWEIVLFVGWLELFVMKDVEGTGNEFSGDFRNGFDFGWDVSIWLSSESAIGFFFSFYC